MGNKKKEEVIVEETIIETPAEVTEEVPAEEVIEETTNVALAEENEVTEETVIETPAEEEVVIEEVIDQCDETAHGVVIADRLNVRKEADKEGDVLTIISKGTGVTVNLTKSTEEFYYVTILFNNEFVDAYCVKDFIKIN
jgi:uncharacterized protein YgiM (DUF1202 family)